MLLRDRRPLVIVPKTTNLARAFDDDLLRIRRSVRAQQNGVLVIAPRALEPAAIVVACHLWPFVLRSLAIRRVGLVLGVQTYLMGEPVFARCMRCMRRYRVTFACFHEGQLDSDCIHAWFERRKSRWSPTSESMLALGERYVERGDQRGAFHAREIADQLSSRRARPSR
jgi:hypothetical protein